MRKLRTPFRLLYICTASLLFGVGTVASLVNYVTESHRFFWLEGSSETSRITGEGSETRIFYGRYRAAGQLGYALVRLTRRSNGWFGGRSDDPPTQNALLDSALTRNLATGFHTIYLWPITIGCFAVGTSMVASLFVSFASRGTASQARVVQNV